MKIRAAALASAGAASGLVLALAGPAGALPTGPTTPGGGFRAGTGCTTYELIGQITNGPDAGTPISGTLCVTSSSFIGTVTGSVTVGDSEVLNPFLMRKTSLPAGNIPVSGGFLGSEIAFGGSARVPVDQANATSLARVAAPATVPEFDLSRGQRAARALAGGTTPDSVGVAQATGYGGTFLGLGFGDSGTWRASPGCGFVAPNGTASPALPVC